MADRKKTPDLLGSALSDPAAPVEELPIPIQPAPAPAPAPANGSKTAASRSAKTPGNKKTKSGKKAKVTASKTESASPASPAPAAPPVWEYLTVVFRDYGGWRPRLINGAEVKGWKEQPLIHDYLAQLGREGWEMVSVGERHRNQKEAYFKRVCSK